MKVWLIMMIPLGVAIAGNVHSQNLTLELRDVSVRDALHEIERQSGYSFFYNDSFEDLSKKVTVVVTNETVNAVVTRVLSGTGLTHRFMEGKLIVIVLRDRISSAQITGKVIASDTREPLPGVNITVKGTNRGTITDANGSFTIEVPADAALVFSFVGYVSQELVVEAVVLRSAQGDDVIESRT